MTRTHSQYFFMRSSSFSAFLDLSDSSLVYLVKAFFDLDLYQFLYTLRRNSSDKCLAHTVVSERSPRGVRT